MAMPTPHRETHIGLTGGRRVSIDELATDSETRKKLEDLLVLMNDIERQLAAASGGGADAEPDVPKRTKQVEPA
jgi:hypothetical protein